MGGVVAEVSQEVELRYGEVYVGEVSINLVDAKKGMLRLAVGDGEGASFVEEDFVYGGNSRITGFAVLDWIGNANYIAITVLFFLC